MIEQLALGSDKTLGFKLSGRLHDQDYATFVPLIESSVAKYGKIRLLALFQDFRGWDVHALWDDIKFSAHHCLDVERVALIGDKMWERWMVGVCKPFTMAKIRYFDATEFETAKDWLGEA